MRQMKRIQLLAGALAGCMLLCACQKPVVPPADYDEPETTVVAESDASETTGEDTTEITTVPETEPDSAEETDPDATDADTTEPPTTSIAEGPSTVAWAAAYEKLLKLKDIRSEHEDAYYALLQFNPDKVPEIIILDGISMELYYYEDGEAKLLMEDGYKSAAVNDQNVCYQPIIAWLASGFSTMGGGSGYNLYFYKKLDPLHAERICFDNNEDEGGEMPYNAIWDRAEEYGVVNNGWHDVTLDEPWVTIDEEFGALRDLEAVDAESLLKDWDKLLNGDEEASDED